MWNKKRMVMNIIIIVAVILTTTCQTANSKRWTTEDAIVFEKDPPVRPGPSLFDYEDSYSTKVKRGNKKPERYYEMIDDEVYVFEPSSLGAKPFLEAMQQEEHFPQLLQQQPQRFHHQSNQKVPQYNNNKKPTHFNKISFPQHHPQNIEPLKFQVSSNTNTVANSDVGPNSQGDCLTQTDKDGQCVPFRICYPVVFNIIDGQLRNIELAKILYKASGPCDRNYTFKGWDEILRPHIPNQEDPALPSDFYNDTICCPGLYEVNSIPQESESLKPSLPDPEFHPPPSEFETDEQTADSGSDYYTDEYDDHQMTYTTTDIPRINPKTLGNSTTNSTSSETKREAVHSDGAESNRSEVKVDSSPKGKSLRPSDGKKSSNSKLIKFQEGPVPVIVAPPHTSAWSCPGRHIGMPRGHWPWMVALLNEGSHFCSGTLIDHRHVLTSASCLNSFQGKDIGKLRVILGDRVLYSSVDGPHTWRKIVRITRHIQYNPTTMEHDIAILEMDMSVAYTSNIQPINLPPSDDRSHTTKAIVSGWSGADIGKRFFAPRIATDAIVEFMDTNECSEKYSGFISGRLPRDRMCTKPSNNSCVADPGAPLMMKTENCWHIIGILSTGLGCGTFPEIFTNTARHMAWIQKNIRQYVLLQDSFRPL